MRRTPGSPSLWWMRSQTRADVRPGACARAQAAPRSSRGVRGGRSSSWMRWWPRRVRRCSRSSLPVLGSSSRTCRPSHCTCTSSADPAGRRAVVGRLDLDAAVEVHRALAEAVVAEGLERQRPEGGLLLGKHRRHLALGRAVDARVGPALLPAVEVRLRLLEALEAQPLERRPLGVADARLDLALAIGVADPARQRDDAVVREHVAVERIQRGVVDVRREDALAQVVEDDDAHRAAQPPEGLLVQLGPDLRARAPHEQPHRLARVAERQDEEPRPAVLARARVADHRPLAVVDLAFLARARS